MIRSRYCIQRIELRSTKKVKNKICARLLIDGEVVHKLPPIEKGQPLVWERSLFCNASPDSIFRLNVHEESYFGLRRTPKYHYEFPTSEIQNNRPNQLIERTGNTLSALVSFSNPETALPGAVAAAQSMQAPPAALERLGRLRPAFEAIINFGTAVSEIVPITNAALALFQGAWQKLEEQARCDENIEQLLVGFADILRSVRPVKELVYSEDLKRTITDILELIQNASQFIVEYKSESEIRRLGNGLASSPQDKVQDFLGQLKRLKENFDRELNVQEHLNRMNEELGKLKPISHSTFRHRHPCLEGTRTAIISDINQWVQKDVGSDRLLWVHGLAGLGKSSIATSICQLLEDRSMLAANFFCKRDDSELREPQRVMNTLIYNLARHYADYRKLVISVIRNDPGVCDLPISLQYNDLVKAPLMTLADSDTAPKSPIVVVVDALDECGTVESRRELLSCLVDMSRRVSWLKAIVTSRPDQDIEETLGLVPEANLKRMNVREWDASEDIYTYLRERMGNRSGDDSQFEDTTIRSLGERAAGLFIWAETACRFILDGFDPQERLDEVLKSSDTGDATTQLDDLYSTALLNSMKGTSGDNKKLLKKCIGIIVATGFRTPMPVSTLERLLNHGPSGHIRPKVLNRVVKALGSVLYEDGQGAVRVYHPSFTDYITTPSRSNDLCVDLEEQDTILSTCCLNTMLKELKFNICGLETSYKLNQDVSDLASRVGATIGPHLSYSCQYWASHIVAADPTQVNMETLRQYLFGRTLFYWIEALSLLGELDTAVSALLVFVRWNRNPDDCVRCANDVYRFILSFYEVISQSTPHLYLSALPFTPTQSELGQRGLKFFPNTLKLRAGAQKSWTRYLRSVTHPSDVHCIAFSPDGRHIVSGCDDGTLWVWDSETGASAAPPLKLRVRGAVFSVAFSPDGRRIVSGSSDNMVHIWDAETGAKACPPLNGHSDFVFSVAFSPDGRRIVSGSKDKTVRIWDAETGAEASPPLKGHSDFVKSVAFSPDGQRIVSGSMDKTVRIWDAETGVEASPPLEGHDGVVFSVAYSPDGRHIVSGSGDSTVQVWDAETVTEAPSILKGHSGPVSSVAFSPNGRYIVSGSDDNTVRVWDAKIDPESAPVFEGHITAGVVAVAFSPDGRHFASSSSDGTMRLWDTEAGAEESPQLNGHSGPVSSVAFSPDGQRIISGSSDRTVRIWDGETGAEVSPPLKGHSDFVSSITFSPDGRCIVTGPSDKTVRTWDAETGAETSPPLEGHSERVLTVAFSPDGRRIVSGSNDKTVRIWEVERGAEAYPPLTGHSGCVNSVGFSPDGRRIVSGSGDNTVRIWDTETGTETSPPLKGHASCVNCVAFSPNDQRVVSGSCDSTLRVWDIETGAEACPPLKGHHDRVRSVAFSPDGRYIVSGSDDKTVRIWDAETGAKVFSPLRGHSAMVTSVAFSPSGQHVVSGSLDKTVRTWAIDYTTASGLPDNPASLLQSMRPDGWVSPDDASFLFWIPSELRHAAADVSLLCISRNPLHSRIEIDFSNFKHGTSWTLVATT